MLVKQERVSIGDIADVSCAAKPVENKVKTLRLPTEKIKGPGGMCFPCLT